MSIFIFLFYKKQGPQILPFLIGKISIYDKSAWKRRTKYTPSKYYYMATSVSFSYSSKNGKIIMKNHAYFMKLHCLSNIYIC